MELDCGRITIDGLDISRLGVHQLRSRMAIIPQVTWNWLTPEAFVALCATQI